MSTTASPRLRILLVEDDDGDALLVEDNLYDAADLEVEFLRARSLAEIPEGARVDVLLVDLGLPDAQGIDAVHRAQQLVPNTPLIVLTGRSDRAATMPALAAGADDWLVKSEVSPERLSRSIRYAVQRRRAEQDRRALLFAAERERHNAQLGHRLLPTPLTTSISVWWHYQPSTSLEVGGDFFDVVECVDGTIRALIGDVSGHGPDEAALGISMRIAWRSLVLADTPDDKILPLLARILVAERGEQASFATVCDVTVAPDRSELTYRLAGHPPPLLVSEALGSVLPVDRRGPPVGAIPDVEWHGQTVSVIPEATLVLYTDGLIDQGPDRWIEPERLASSLAVGDLSSKVALRTWTEGFLPPEEQTRDDLAVVAISFDGRQR